VDMIERYAVAGGMSLYLDELGRDGTLRQRVCARVLDPRGPLFNGPREVLEEEPRSPGVYYSLLEELSSGRKSLADLAAALGRRTPDLQGYLRTLRGMRVVDRHAPVTAREDERNHRWELSDGFMRFWFRFVFPFQEDLKTGSLPESSSGRRSSRNLPTTSHPPSRPSAGSGCCVLAEPRGSAHGGATR